MDRIHDTEQALPFTPHLSRTHKTSSSKFLSSPSSVKPSASFTPPVLPNYFCSIPLQLYNHMLLCKSGVPNPAPGDRCPAKFSYNANQTHLLLAIQTTLIRCFRFVWLYLELNFAGQQLPGTGLGTPNAHNKSNFFNAMIWEIQFTLTPMLRFHSWV